MRLKYLLVITEPAGLAILDTPRAQSSGANRRRAEAVGKALYAHDVLLFDGVPYAYLAAQDPNKPEWCRVSEAGGVIIENGKVQQISGVKAYVKVVDLQGDDDLLELQTDDDFSQALKELATANTLLARTLTELAKK